MKYHFRDLSTRKQRPPDRYNPKPKEEKTKTEHVKCGLNKNISGKRHIGGYGKKCTSHKSKKKTENSRKKTEIIQVTDVPVVTPAPKVIPKRNRADRMLERRRIGRIRRYLGYQAEECIYKILPDQYDFQSNVLLRDKSGRSLEVDFVSYNDRNTVQAMIEVKSTVHVQRTLASLIHQLKRRLTVSRRITSVKLAGIILDRTLSRACYDTILTKEDIHRILLYYWNKMRIPCLVIHPDVLGLGEEKEERQNFKIQKPVAYERCTEGMLLEATVDNVVYSGISIIDVN